jgi:hypothetical protein
MDEVESTGLVPSHGLWPTEEVSIERLGSQRRSGLDAYEQIRMAKRIAFVMREK